MVSQLDIDAAIDRIENGEYRDIEAAELACVEVMAMLGDGPPWETEHGKRLRPLWDDISDIAQSKRQHEIGLMERCILQNDWDGLKSLVEWGPEGDPFI